MPPVSSRRHCADLVIAGIGLQPTCELAAAAGLECDDGIAVDEYMVTTDPDILAIGDCASFPHHSGGVRLRLESVPNALEQARVAAATLAGKRRPYSALPWFWSDQYDLKLQIAGLSRARLADDGVPLKTLLA
jgi:3-phenylpropionate/trans-cinnamate dioxygenase ferredoxin reductase subunit